MKLICVLPCFFSVAGLWAQSGADWPSYLGGEDRSHYSTLAQITPANVQRLEVAWMYRSGDFKPDMRKQIQCNPLVVGGVLYGTTALQKLVALDAATGRELWRFDPPAQDLRKYKLANLQLDRSGLYWLQRNTKR